ncbi:MAG: alpha/beta fold hydrolase [Candidatus Moraniibacteriota bacterium]
MKRVFIIHGWGGSPEANWFPWMKKELEKRKISIEVLAMPNTDNPKMEEWLDFMREKIGKIDEDIFLVGHSLGCIAILRYLESLSEGEKVGGALLVAGFSRSINIPELENFFQTPLDYEKVKKSVRQIGAINSDNDYYVPMEEGKILEEKLGAKLVVLHKAFHLNEGNGFFELPTGLEELLKMINN